MTKRMDYFGEKLTIKVMEVDGKPSIRFFDACDTEMPYAILNTTLYDEKDLEPGEIVIGGNIEEYFLEFLENIGFIKMTGLEVPILIEFNMRPVATLNIPMLLKYCPEAKTFF